MVTSLNIGYSELYLQRIFSTPPTLKTESLPSKSDLAIQTLQTLISAVQPSLLNRLFSTQQGNGT